MPVGIGDVVRIGVQWIIDNTDQQVNVHHLGITGVDVSGDDEDFMVAMAAALKADLYAPILDLLVTMLQGDLLVGQNLTENEVLPVVPHTIDGTNADANALPYQVAGLIYLNGNQPRRQGRCYIGGWGETGVAASGTWDANALDDLTAFAAAFLLPISDGDWSALRIVSNAAGTNWFLPTFAGFSADPRTQRRRTKGRGA